MADYVVRMSAQDNLSGTIKQVKNAVNDLGNAASTNLDKFKQRFERIEGSAAPLKKQLRDLKALMSEMNFKGLSGTEEFTRIAQYAGQVKDAMDDAGAAAKRFSDDTFALRAAADAFTLVTGATTALTGAMNLFGVKSEEVKNAILKVQSAMAILNGVQAVANALNKDSALMQALKAMKMRYTTEMTRLNSIETNKNTISEIANKAATEADAAAKGKSAIATNLESGATKKSTITQQAWNVAKAIGKALLGDFTGLLIVGAGVAATYAMATANSTDAIEGQTDALKDNSKTADTNTMWKERLKKSEKEWSDAVTSNASNQISQYTRLQLKWLDCNRDQKLKEKFQREYGEEVNRVAGKVKKLSEYEDFFVRDTDKVVEAILARAAAEAGAEQYAKAVLRKAENDRNGTVANGRYYYNANAGTAFNDLSPEEQAYLKRVGGANASQNPYLQYHAGWSSYWEINEAGAKQVEQFRKNVASSIRAQDDAEIDFWKNWSLEQAKVQAKKEEAAGMGTGKYNPPKAFGGGGGSPKGSSGSSNKGGSGTDKKTEEEVKPVAQSLEWMRQQLQELQKQLSYGLIPADKIEETKSKIEYLKKEIEKKEIELGFKIVPVSGSLSDLENQLSKLKNDLSNGLIPADKIDDTEKEIDDLQKRIKAKKIQLGFEEAPETDYEKRIDAYLEYIKDTEEAIKKFDEAKVKIDKELAAADADLAKQLRDGLITQKEYTEKSEKLWEDYAEKLGNLPEVIVYNKPPQSMDNIARFYEDEISKIEKALSENDLDIEARIELNEKKADLQRKLNDILHGELSIPAKIDSDYITKGSAEDFRASYENASQQIQQIADDYAKGIIKSSSEARQKVAEINAELLKLGMKPIEIEIKTKGQQVLEDTQEYLGQFNDVVVGTVDSIGSLVKSIDEGASGWEIFKNALSTAEQIMTSIGTVMQVINTLQDAYNVSKLVGNSADEQSASNKAVEAIAQSAIASSSPAVVGAIEAQATAAGTAIAPLKTLASATTELAAAQMFAAHASIPFVGGALGAAQVGIMMGTLAALKALDKFAGGGIVGGNSYFGDKLVARVNSGEMILNQRQQRNLFNAINSGDIGGNSTPSVTWRIKGADLYGTLKNYQKIKGKSGIITGIQ